jgi:stress response protein YsnF
VIERIDLDDDKVYVSLTKDQIKNAPEFDQATYRDAAYRSSVGSYYGADSQR